MSLKDFSRPVGDIQMRLSRLAVAFSVFGGLGIAGALGAGSDFPALDRFESTGHVLDVTLIAGPREVAINGRWVTTNVYTTCYSHQAVAADGSVDCPTGSDVNPYGGPLLAVAPGDRLKITLVNRMENGADPADMLITNLHTHGLLVRARGLGPEDQVPADAADGYEDSSIGDFVYIAAQPEGTAPIAGHAAHPVDGRSTLRFDIQIPADHPKGIFWFHPHPHMLSKKQVSGGMAGMIAVGDPDYLCLELGPDGTCAPDGGLDPADPWVTVREILLKDSQIVDVTDAGASMYYDQQPDFCGDQVAALNPEPFCTGGVTDDSGQERTGEWVFSLNGVANPGWQVAPEAEAEVWRIQNASANITYNLCFSGAGFSIDPEAAQPCDDALPVQVLSLDGVAFGSTLGQGSTTVPVEALQRRVILMPGSRIEIAVTLRDHYACAPGAATNESCPVLAAPAGDTTLTLQTLLYETGGDAWPPATLGHVTFTGAGTDIAALSTTDFTRPAAPESFREGAAPFRESPFTQAQCRSGGLRVLGEGEKRRIYFAILEDDGEERFLLGHTVIGADGSETDERGQPVTEPVLRPFDMMRTAADLCVLGGPGAKDETWQLVNISHEVHNFHIHQGKFSLVCEPGVEPCRMRFHPVSDVDKVNLANAVAFAEGKQQEIGAMIHDTIIVPRGSSYSCESAPIETGGAAPSAGSFLQRVADFDPDHPAYVYLRDQASCAAPTPATEKISDAGWIEVKIPFDQPYSLGKYVFHCHILEHEDLGMMAAIRVLDPSQMDVVADAGAGMGDAPPAPMDHAAHGGDSGDSGGDAAAPINDLINGGLN